jgi:hypothetical protein
MTPAQWCAWAFQSVTGYRWHRKLRRETGEVYMDRWQLLRTRLLSVYIHRINLPDADPLPHTHPWRASWSLKLKGSYIEEVYDVVGRVFFRIPPRFNRIPDIHRIVQLGLRGEPCWTLFIGWRADQPWGFVDYNGEIIPAEVRRAERGVQKED